MWVSVSLCKVHRGGYGELPSSTAGLQRRRAPSEYELDALPDTPNVHTTLGKKQPQAMGNTKHGTSLPYRTHRIEMKNKKSNTTPSKYCIFIISPVWAAGGARRLFTKRAPARRPIRARGAILYHIWKYATPSRRGFAVKSWWARRQRPSTLTASIGRQEPEGHGEA